MAKYLYEVSFSEGRSNPEFQTFLRNVTSLNAKAPDYGGINNRCVVSHHMPLDVVQMLCGEGLKKRKGDLSVVEITKATLASPDSGHRLFTGLIERYFLPYHDYPNLE